MPGFEYSLVPVPAGARPRLVRSPFSIGFECIGDESGGRGQRLNAFSELIMREIALAYRLPEEYLAASAASAARAQYAES